MVGMKCSAVDAAHIQPVAGQAAMTGTREHFKRTRSDCLSLNVTGLIRWRIRPQCHHKANVHRLEEFAVDSLNAASSASGCI